MSESDIEATVEARVTAEANKKTHVLLELSWDINSCPYGNPVIVSGWLSSISTDWRSNKIILENGIPLKVEIPDGGAYRGAFSTAFMRLGPEWDKARYIRAGEITPWFLFCDSSTP